MRAIYRATALATVAAGAFTALPASALPTSAINNGRMVLEDDSGEFVLRRNNDNGFDAVTGRLEVGDLFGGVLDFTSVNGTPVGDYDTELTGIFLAELTNINANGNTTRDGVTYQRGDFTFGQASNLMDAVFGIDPVDAGTFAHLYEDDAQNLNLFSSNVGPTSQADAIAKATDGDLFMQLGFGPDTTFQGFDAPLNLSIFSQVDAGTRVGDFNIDDALITAYNGPGTLTSNTTDGNGSLFGVVNDNVFPVEDDLELTVQVVPAPSPLALLGVGLLGLGLASRRGNRG